MKTGIRGIIILISILQSSKVVEAMHYLTAVMGGYDAEALSEACLRLTEIIKHGKKPSCGTGNVVYEQ